MSTRLRSHEDYTVGWICALPKEQIAAISMLDDKHPDLPKSPNDANAYTLGSIKPHNVVITCLPLKCYGTNQTARATAQMLNTFSSIRVVLMVGIGAGIPASKVKLGDVVISTEWVQWDFGKSNKDGTFEHIDKRCYPPTELLSAISKLQTNYRMHGTMIPQYLNDITTNYPDLALQYTSIGNPKDVRVHYGLIASGNQVVKDATVRDVINKRLNNQVLCIEMEAAGLVGPAIVIRGICDYADSEKNDDWQEYAAAVAAACAKELLECIQPSTVSEIKYGKEDFNKIVDELTTLRYNLTGDEDRRILKWITPIDDSLQHNDFLNRRQPETGEWLLASPQYQNWLNTAKEILFCPGIPGAGKTIITSAVIDNLIDRYSYNPTIGIAYIYFNFKGSAHLKIDDLLLSLLKQLSRTQASLPEHVKQLYNRYKDGRPSRTDIIKTLHSVAGAYSRVFIVIDALDEYRNNSAFLEELFKMHQNYSLNIFATSRHIPEIRQKFKRISIECEIRASDEDIRSYLDGQISRLGTIVVKNNKERIKEEISKAVQGMFLLAHLYFDAIKTAMTLKAIIKTLNGFAMIRGTSNGAYDSTYQAIMERIKENDKTSINIAFQVLSWITCASRPLTKAELQHAIAVEPDIPELDKENISEIEDLVSVCKGLVTIDEESDIVRLIHYTAQEYFERNQQLWFPHSHSDIAKICLIYLSYNNFKSKASSYEEFQERLLSNALYDYAAKNWGYHVRESWIENEHSRELSAKTEADWCTRHAGTTSLVLDLLLEDNLRSSCAAALFGWDERDKTLGLHILAHFGLTPVMEILWAEKRGELEAKNDSGKTPLHIAAQCGHENVVKLLVEKGANIEARDYGGRTPLWIAAQYGHESVVRLLAEKGANLEAADDWRIQTPLGIAASDGHESVVRLLVEKGANLEAQDVLKRTPLHIAAKHGHESVVRLLVEKGANLEAQDPLKRTPLHIAAEHGHESVVRLLVEKGANLKARDYEGQTPLLIAAEHGQEGVVRLLTEMGTSAC